MRLFLPAAIVVVLDQISKYLFWTNARNYEIVDGFFNIILVKNAGAAFGVLQGGRAFFVAASVVAIVIIIYMVMKMPREERARRVWLGMILGGAIGNLIDRVRSGEVVDFLQIGIAGHYWPVFNVADVGVSVGAALLVVHALRPRGRAAPAAGVEASSVASEDSPLRP